ncbi:MAG: CDP-alcohol phosphatidyltransferase family protein [Candidatus Krumholzibacteriia bacterium]
MDNEALKQNMRGRVRPLVLWLDGLGATPLSISLVGLAFSLLAGWIVAQVSLLLGALVFLVGAGLDMLDGDLARLQGTVSRRGAFLDSCLDRLGESALFAGLAWYFMAALKPNWQFAVLMILFTVVGSLTTSYVRARAEGLGETCRVGWLQRPERVVLLVVGMVLGRWVLMIVLTFLAIATLATTVQRIVHVARKLPGPGPRHAPSAHARDPEDDFGDPGAPGGTPPGEVRP